MKKRFLGFLVLTAISIRLRLLLKPNLENLKLSI